MMRTNPFFTVFTPTFNRAHTLKRVYESLAAQTFRDFEWLIVDDGSTDATRELIVELQGVADFPIRYLHQENLGKHAAFNNGVKNANGDLFLNLDSDDSCVPSALEAFTDAWSSIPEDARSSFTGVTSLCSSPDGAIIGDRFPTDAFTSDSIEFEFIYKWRGEKWGFHRTEVLREFPFPKVDGARFLPENIVWLSIARKYKTLFINQALRIYHLDSGNQITGAAKKVDTFPLYVYNAFALSQILPSLPLNKLTAKVYANFTRYALQTPPRLRKAVAKKIDVKSAALLVALSPLGAALYARDQFLRR